jgi:NADH:ubiquinone oxidoreductase subunit 3 (subunit A)
MAQSDKTPQVVNARMLLKAAYRAIVVFITILLIQCQLLDVLQTALALTWVPQRGRRIRKKRFECGLIDGPVKVCATGFA